MFQRAVGSSRRILALAARRRFGSSYSTAKVRTCPLLFTTVRTVTTTSTSSTSKEGRNANTPALAVAVGLATLAAYDTLTSQERTSPSPWLLCEAPSTTTSTTLARPPSSSDVHKTFRLKDEYDIVKVLGEGAYGMVYRARRKSDNLPVALKAMPREYTGQTDFEREVAALQLLSSKPTASSNTETAPKASKDVHHHHQHIVQLVDLHRDDDNYYLAMELIEGDELLEHLIDHGPYSEGLAASFLRQFAEALCHVHNSGLIHADLKPENLMIVKSNNKDSLTQPSSTDAKDQTIRDGRDRNMDDGSSYILKVVDFGCACSHDLSRKDMQLPAEEFAMGCSFLHQVALGNQFELEKILQERPSLVNFRDYDKRTALHLAASEGHLDICRYLVGRGAQINRSDRWGGSPLDDAYRHKHTEVIQFLKQQGAKFGSQSQATNFITAASGGDNEEVKALLEFGNIELNEGDYDKRTALHLAAGEGHLDTVQLLCEAGADVNVQDRWGNRPIDDAKNAKRNSRAIMKMLEEHGANSAILSTMGQEHSTGPEEEELDIAGTLAYWPPEQFLKGAAPTPAGDMWATGIIMFILLTGSHPFDKYADSSDAEIKATVSSLRPNSEESSKLLDTLVFDERVKGLSNSCVELMRSLMHLDPDKRMTSEQFLSHPWIQGLTASWKTMEKTHGDLKAFWQNRFRTEILKKFASSTSTGETLSEADARRIFLALDVKQNGALDLEDIQAAFHDLGITDKVLNSIFDSADLDGTGLIRWDEFRALMSKHIGEGPGLQVKYLQERFRSHVLNKLTKKEQENLTSNNTELREMFKAINLKRNGVLDPHEIRVFLRSVGESDDVISKIIASLDLNRDGGVSWDEFLEIMNHEEK